MDNQAILRAIDHFGSQAALARAVGVYTSFVSHWATNRRPVPAKWCRLIEQATDGAVTRYELREDIFGPAPSTTEAA